LIENRQPLGSDTALLNPSRPGGKLPGLLVWHIDPDKIAADGLRTTNSVNSGPHHGVALLQADGLDQLDESGSSNRGDGGDPYPGWTGNRRLSWLSNPRAEDRNRQFAGFMIDAINDQVSGGRIQFRFTRRDRSLIAADVPDVPVTVDGRTWPRYEEVLVPGQALV